MATIDNGSDLGIEASLFKAADKLRGNMEPSATNTSPWA
jgi:type I restriction enzyme M protein